VAWRLARAQFFLGQQSEIRQSAAAFYRQGIENARHAAQERFERVEGHFWLGVNLALAAQLETPLKALVHALQASRALEKAIRLDAGYHAAGPLRVLARLQDKLPRALGGGWRRAVENYQRAITIAPSNTVTRIYFAELLLKRGEVTRAQRELETVLTIPQDDDWAFEIERDKELARQMLRHAIES
jgi:tetratricopeptide (TPR) repeat protein